VDRPALGVGEAARQIHVAANLHGVLVPRHHILPNLLGVGHTPEHLAVQPGATPAVLQANPVPNRAPWDATVIEFGGLIHSGNLGKPEQLIKGRQVRLALL
jgi:hypothetical protein